MRSQIKEDGKIWEKEGSHKKYMIILMLQHFLENSSIFPSSLRRY
jgi:hypothetical protein